MKEAKKWSKILRFVAEWKGAACMLFTASVTIYLAISLWYGQRQVPTLALWGLLWISLTGALLQLACFSNFVFKKLRYCWRSLLFVLLFLPVLSLAAWKTGWFPARQPGAWMTFLGLFFLIFLVMSIGFEFYFQMTGKKYNGLIGQYRKAKEVEKKER